MASSSARSLQFTSIALRFICSPPPQIATPRVPQPVIKVAKWRLQEARKVLRTKLWRCVRPVECMVSWISGSKADAAGCGWIQQGEIQGREREREIWLWWLLLPRWHRRSQPRHLASGVFLILFRGWDGWLNNLSSTTHHFLPSSSLLDLHQRASNYVLSKSRLAHEF